MRRRKSSSQCWLHSIQKCRGMVAWQRSTKISSSVTVRSTQGQKPRLYIFVQCGNDCIKSYSVHYGRNCNDWPTRRSSMSLGSDQRGWFTFDWHNDAKIEMLFTLTYNYSSSIFKLTFNASTFNVSTRCSVLAITPYLILCTRAAVICFLFFSFFFFFFF